ncbi:hypothetical protein R3W88_027760 [Solanum pinnatisectum]|uniref:Uncharacterized protein n=1 Tax=Solanum pinnatisectum TaxID=50273 RepID=A0AAV9LH56_9SOLN|nr:hypothetical protein R3W88_027760 [Solanum pinnatisectum]
MVMSFMCMWSIKLMNWFQLPVPTDLLPWSDPVDESVECDSDDSTDMLDAETVRGVDLPGKRKRKKDLQLGTGQGLTVMSDMQKVIVYYFDNCRYVEISHPEPTSSYQPGPTRFNQPAPTTSSNHASSTTVCDNTSRVKRVRETAKTSQPPPFVDTSIPVTRGITSQLPPRTRQTAGQKRIRVATGEDSARGGPKRPTNGGSSNVGFGIYTSASGTPNTKRKFVTNFVS